MEGAERKEAVRRAARAALTALKPARRALEEEAVQAAIQGTPAWRSARTVLLYAAKPPEFSVVGLTLAAWREGKATLFPRVRGPRQLDLCEVRGWTDLAPGAFGIREPAVTLLPSPLAPDLCIVPGVAFTPQGRRVGQGGGYYDALLPQVKAPAWGVAFDCQVLREVPWEPHDATVSEVWSCVTKGLLSSGT